MTADAWTMDRLLGGRVLVRQPTGGYRIAIDPILLAASVEVHPGARILDLGAGVGGATLPLAWRRPDLGVVALEWDPELAAAAADNARRNGFADRVVVLRADAALPPFGPATFDAVITNPPFLPADRGSAPRTERGRRARQEGPLPLADWLDVACGLVRPGGWVHVVQRADRLGELAAALGRWSRGLDVLPLWPKAGRAARRVLVRACVGRTRPGRLLPGLVLHGPDGHFTEEAERILRDAGALSWEMR